MVVDHYLLSTGSQVHILLVIPASMAGVTLNHALLLLTERIDKNKLMLTVGMCCVA